MSNELNQLILNDNEEDSDDDNEDCDYKPENDALSADSDSGSDSPFDEFEDSNKKGKRSKKRGPKGRRKHEDKDEDEEEVTKVENKLNEEEEKAKADSLWAEFCKDMPVAHKSNKTETTNNTNSLTLCASSTLNNDKTTNNTNSDQNKKVLISKTYDFAGESVTVSQEVEANSSVASIQGKVDNKGKEEGNKGVKRSVGLGGILDQLKKPKISTLQKSLIDWNNFKKEEGIEEELSQHNKSKDTFIERQAFLQRTDLRQFELEREIRAKERAQRQLSKN